MFSKKRTILLITLLALGSFVAYHQFFYTSEQVNSNIFRSDKTLSAHTAEVWTVKFSPNGTAIASGSVDGTVKIHNRENGKLLLNLKHPIGVTALAFAPNGSMLATGSYDAKIRFWKLPEGKLIKELSGHDGTIWAIDFSADGKTLLSSGETKRLNYGMSKAVNCYRHSPGIRSPFGMQNSVLTEQK